MGSDSEYVAVLPNPDLRMPQPDQAAEGAPKPDAIASTLVRLTQTCFRFFAGRARFPERKRPGGLAYDVDEVPPASLTVALAFQQVLAMSIGWASSMVFRQA